MKTSAYGRKLSAGDVIAIASLVALVAAGFASSAFAGSPYLSAAGQCERIGKDAEVSRKEAQLGAKYILELDRYIAAGAAACASGDLAGANAAYDLVRGMASGE